MPGCGLKWTNEIVFSEFTELGLGIPKNLAGWKRDTYEIQLAYNTYCIMYMYLHSKCIVTLFAEMYLPATRNKLIK